MILLTAAFWVLIYGNRPDRGYILKDPVTAAKQFDSRQACETTPFYLGTAKFKRCTEVKSVSCYNDGSVCRYDPVNPDDTDGVPRLVPWPE